MSDSKVSVIVPVYNVEGYIQKCIETILNQTYKNLELVLVDDGSTDGSGAICESYKLADNRVVVLHKDNSGSSDSRNMGIDIATGDYLMFVDSDDYVSPNIVSMLLSDMMKLDVDLSIVGYQAVTPEDNPDEAEEYMDQNGTSIVLDSQTALQRLMYQKQVTNSPWAKLYKKELFNGVRYPSGKINQDLGTTYKLFSNAKKISLSGAKLYYYMQREGSVINSPFSMKRMAGLEFAREQLNFISSHYPLIKLAAENRLFTEVVSIYLKIQGSENSKDYATQQNECMETIINLRSRILFDRRSRLQPRLSAAVSYLGTNTFSVIGLWFKKKALKRIVN